MQIALLRSRIPWLMALIFGVLWSGLYTFLGILHGMPGMFDADFPFLLISFLGIHNGSMAATTGAAVAFVDGAVVAFAMGLIFALVIGGRSKGEED